VLLLLILPKQIRRLGNDVRPPLKNFTDMVIYEVHMRDFSVSPNSGMKNKGKFLAFTEHGTKNTAAKLPKLIIWWI
jgi:pullulanase/glycogen debranching enzyme